VVVVIGTDVEVLVDCRVGCWLMWRTG